MKAWFFGVLISILGYSYSALAQQTITVPDDYSTIDSALTLSDPGAIIRVNPGIYYTNPAAGDATTLVIDGGRKLQSRFSANGDTSYIRQTILDGNKNGTVIRLTDGEIEGFTIQNGYVKGEDFVGGIRVDANSDHETPNLVSHCIVKDNYGVKGGGVRIKGPDRFDTATIQNTIIINNYSEEGGGGVRSDGIEFNMHNSIIYNNVSEQWGGGLNIGGGVQHYITHSLIYKNKGKTGVGGGGINIYGRSYPMFVNSIIWGNEHPSGVGEQIYVFEGGGSLINSIVQNLGIKSNEVPFIEESIDLDPKIIYSNGRFYLHTSSPAIGAANIYDQQEIDIYGGQRPYPSNSTGDIGPFEHWLSSPKVFEEETSETKIIISIDADSLKDGRLNFDFVGWSVNGELKSTSSVAELEFEQGTNDLEMIYTIDDSSERTTEYHVSVFEKNRQFADTLFTNSGVTTLGSDLTYLPLADGKMQILDNNFEDQFDLLVDGEVRSVSSVSQDSTVYISSTSRVVYSFDKFGIPVWDSPLGGELQATPTIDNKRNLLYVGVSNSNLFAVDRTTGSVVWNDRLDAPINQPGIIIESDYLYVTDEEGKAYYYDLDAQVTGQQLNPISTYTTGDSIGTSAAVDNSNNIYLATKKGNLTKFRITDSLELDVAWSINVSSSFNVSPVIAHDGAVLLGGTDSTLYAMVGTTGATKWEFKTQGAITSTPTINDYGVVYVGDETGTIYAISDSGDLLWEFNTSSAIGNATAYINGRITFTNEDGELYKIYDGWRFDGTQGKRKFNLKIPQWRTYQGNFQRSGNANDEVTTSKENVDLAPESFQLLQNYPNPFNPSTQIRYSLPNATEVKLSVYNMLGQSVATLVDGRQNSGWHTAFFDASGLSSGLYIYRLQAGGFMSTKKLMLIK
ncbi:MAG: hypothetical protein CL670_04670 [Balneola sp.]|jgi:outer membrane protein assembly factor BamB|nr:hypothetical protein [Balneola sp.]MBE78424.1 hypothetical protein [Balneola sp.]|tara:strand:- start:265 stop:2982 length:2718 start_codon:yes stop_codon:yes gene_type:complete